MRYLFSLLPFSALDWLHDHAPVGTDSCLFDWSFWKGAKYTKIYRSDWRAERIR